MTSNSLATIEADPRAVIEALLVNDPRLISKHTTRQYKADLFHFEAWRQGREITKSLVEAYAAELQAAGKAPRTINQRLAAVRWYARKIADLAADYSHDPQLADFYAKQAARVVTVRDVKGDSEAQAGRHIEQGELSALMEACYADATPAGARDAAIIALAWSTGLRRDELARLTRANLSKEHEDALDITILGKGRKKRTVYVNDGALAALTDWLELRGNLKGALFVPVNKGGAVLAGQLSGEALRVMLEKRSGQAGLTRPITWHDFRRTFAGNLWGAGIDGVTIQKLMGHASQNQTARYDRRPEESKRQAVKVLHVPYRKRGT